MPVKRLDRATTVGFATLLFSLLVQACAPPTLYRSPGPSLASRSPRPPLKPRAPVVEVPREREVREERKRPVLSPTEIREQDLEENRLARTLSVPAPSPSEQPLLSREPQPLESRVLEPSIAGKIELPVQSAEKPSGLPKVADEEAVAVSPQPENLSLIAMISPQTPPRSALSLRLAEEGRKFLEDQEYARGLARLERAISMDSRNRFAYYYLAEAHHALDHHKQSLNFLEIVEAHFADQPIWLARIHALRGKNFESLGFFERADESYVRALKLDPRNPVALEGISEMRWATPKPLP